MKKRNFNTLTISFFATLFGLVAGALLIWAIGGNPIEGYGYIIKGALGIGFEGFSRLGDTLSTSAPLILTGLSVAFAFRTGLFNIGAAGQMLFGGFCALAVGLSVNLPQPLMIPLIILVSFVGGAFWGLIPGLLKAIFNVHEVVSTIMLNWISYWLVYYGVQTFFKAATIETESKQVPEVSSLRLGWLSDLFNDSVINFGIFIAISAVIIVAFILNKTVLGFELKAVGFNRHAAEYAGVNVKRNIVMSMMIAGGLAGLAGAAEFLGNGTSIQIGVMPTQGFDGIAVALIGANTPIGAMFAAFFFAVLYTGKGFMSANTTIPPMIADTIIATIIYFAATSVLIEKGLTKLSNLRGKRGGKNE